MTHVTLLGSEAIQRAGHDIRSAAEEITRAANQIDASIQDLKRHSEDWLSRLETLFSKLPGETTP